MSGNTEHLRAALACLALAAAAGRAANTNWIPTGSGDWSTGSNWSAGEPTIANQDRAIVNNGGTVLVGAGEECYGLTLGNSTGQTGTARVLVISIHILVENLRGNPSHDARSTAR